MRNKILIFLIKICVLYSLWFICYELYIGAKFWQDFNSIIVREILFFSNNILIGLSKIMNFVMLPPISHNFITGAPPHGWYQTTGPEMLPPNSHNLIIGGLPDTLHYFKGNRISEIYISNRCLAIDLMYTYSIFIIAFFGPWKKKIWFILLGILIINTLNIMRVVGLVLTDIYYPQYLNFNHHLLFTYIVYFFTFILWVVWIRKYAKDDIIKIIEEMKEKDKKKKIIES